MSDDKTKKRPKDASEINVHEPYEVAYWTKKFDVSAAELRDAVNAVGVSAAKVAKHLGKSL
ncbi:DUF3606 domain-containing protein [Gluconacetobacter entanii]|uniref:DUF3606 domain-containing protein n=1 Tax=Gluconacetobacter entanii TaxID=108528 RepID=A0ABT3K1Q1_9PROT|nr:MULTISPECIES: DUF3606 domain-containing protein [Acetobacteraceae]MCW4589334.1 DUF3606 domain-containing protein [Gluconacetobacter entanii]MCW4592965.1 DUF3606 domain-containing protein [Gluconacetobacter entanii]NPC89925.1 DUF3606 domain-containing protein [Gluconacetobacter entanii]